MGRVRGVSDSVSRARIHPAIRSISLSFSTYMNERMNARAPVCMTLSLDMQSASAFRMLT